MSIRRVLPYRLTPGEVEDLIHNERERTRRERLVEVRRQTHDFARRIRGRNETTVRLHEIERRERARQKWQCGQNFEVQRLEEIYDERIANLGAAHTEALLERNPKMVEEEKRMVREVRAKSREAIARKVLEEIRENETLDAARPVRRRKFARIVENERARHIITLRTESQPAVPAKAAEKEITMARRIWIAPDWPPTVENRKLLQEPISFRKPEQDIDPVAEAEAERERETLRRREQEWLEEQRKGAAERRYQKALEQVRLASDYKKLMATLKALQVEKIARNQAVVKKSAVEAIQDDEESTSTPSGASASSADASRDERRVEAEKNADSTAASDLERRYQLLLSAGRDVERPEARDDRTNVMKDEERLKERSFGDLDYFPQRDPGSVSPASNVSSAKSSPPFVPPSGVSPRKIRRRNQPVADSSPSSSSSSSVFADSSPSTSSDSPRVQTVHVKGDLLAKYVARALDRLDISQLTSTPSSSTSISTEEVKKPTKREETRPPPPPPAPVDAEIERKREEALRRVLKSSQGRLTPAEATWLAGRICQKFKSASPSSSSTSSTSTKPATKGILKVSSSSGATTSTRDTVLREIDCFLRQMNVVLDETKKSMAVESSVEYSTTTTSSSTTDESATSNGLLTKILEDFTAAAQTAAAAFGRLPRQEADENTLLGETASESELGSPDRDGLLVGETASSINGLLVGETASSTNGLLAGETASSNEVTQKSRGGASAVELIGESATSVTESSTFRRESVGSVVPLLGETASETEDVTPEQLDVVGFVKITSTPIVAGFTRHRRVSKPSSSSSSQPSMVTVTPAAAIRAIPFDTSLSTIRTKRTDSASPSSPDSPI